MPQDLARLCDFSEQNGGAIAGDVMLMDSGPHALLQWFDGDAAAAAKFVVFGRDRSDSFYGYWLHRGPDLALAPIVYLNSEATNNTVLANSLSEFLSLVALGFNHLGLFRTWEPTADAVSTARFQEWLRRELNIEPAADGLAIVTRARAAHPDLDAWIDEWAAGHTFQTRGE